MRQIGQYEGLRKDGKRQRNIGKERVKERETKRKMEMA